MAQQQTTTATSKRTLEMAFIAIFVVLIAICSWISIPTTVPFTLQTFAVSMTVLMLGGRRGTIALAVYILLAAIGVPVLSGFTGGLGVLLGPTGGYIFGWLVLGIEYWVITKFAGERSCSAWSPCTCSARSGSSRSTPQAGMRSRCTMQ